MSTALLPVAPLSVLSNGEPRNRSRPNTHLSFLLCPLPSQLHSVMVHLQQENKKLKTEIEEKKLKAGHPRLCTKALSPSKMEPTQREKVCSTLGWRGITQDMSQRVDITKCIRMPHCSGMSAVCLWLLTMMSSLSPRGQKITA